MATPGGDANIQPGLAIFLRPRHGVNRDIPAGPGAVLRHHRLAQDLGQKAA